MNSRILLILLILSLSYSQIIINLTRKSLKNPTHHRNQNKELKNLIEGDHGNEKNIISTKIQYLSNILVGSEKQEMSVIFNTNSNHFWIPSKDCDDCRKFENRFNYASSSTYRNSDNRKKEIQVFSHNVSGLVSTDNFLIGKGVLVKNLEFTLVNKENNLRNLLADGVIGLGLNSYQDENSFIRQLLHQKLITSPKFSFYLTDSSRDSNLILDDITIIPILNKVQKTMGFCIVPKSRESWTCDLDTVRVGKKDLSMRSKVSFDTSSSLISIPVLDFKEISPYLMENVNTKCEIKSLNQLFCTCSSPKIFPEISLSINGNDIYLRDIIEYNPNEEFQCEFQIQISTEKFDEWVLGQAGLRGMLVAFDLKKRTIGFTQTLAQFPINLNDENVGVSKDEDEKIFFFFGFLFIIIIMGAIYNFSNSKKFKDIQKNKNNEKLRNINEIPRNENPYETLINDQENQNKEYSQTHDTKIQNEDEISNKVKKGSS